MRMGVESARLDWPAGQNRLETFRHTLDKLIPGVPREENGEAIRAAQQILATDSLLVAINHSSKPDTFLALHTVLSSLKSDPSTNVSMLISEALSRPESNDPKSIITRSFCSLWDINVLPVYLPTKGWSSDERRIKNKKTKQDALATLQRPNNILIIFPEGDISPSLLEAKRGLGEFISQGKGWTLPVTSNFHTYLYEPVLGKMPKPLVVHYPISNAELINNSFDHMGQASSDFVLAKIATALPDHQRGFYREISRQLEVNDPETKDLRATRVKGLQHTLYSLSVQADSWTGKIEEPQQQ